jgi:uncharacterized protein YjbI with pentapeptide repeats
MNPKDINNIIKKHEAWLAGKDEGVRACFREADLYGADLFGAYLRKADLRGANLCRVDLREANLREANLIGVNLREANLIEADLYGAYLRKADLREANLCRVDLREVNLYGADLRKADLRGANLYEADLREADLREANLYGADLYGADLNNAKNVPKHIQAKLMCCPEDGNFIGWKKCGEYIIKLLIPEDAKRSSATTRKCRCSKAKVLDIQNLDGSNPGIKKYAHVAYNLTTMYEINEIVYPDSFDENRWNECSHGIHFFITRQEAVEY